MLTENEELVLKNDEIAGTLNEYFGTTAEDLDLCYWKNHDELPLNTKPFHRINNIIKRYKNHPSIKNIKKTRAKFWHFFFLGSFIRRVGKSYQRFVK